MNRIVFAFLFLLMIIAKHGVSQEKPFLFGMKLAPHVGWMKPSSIGYENDGIKAGISWGLVTRFHVMENYDVHSGLNITLMRTALMYPDMREVDGNLVEGDLHRIYDFKYLGIPLTFRMKTNEFAKKRFFGQFGVELNFMLSANSKDKFNAEGIGQTNSGDNIYNELKFARYAVIVGVGMEYVMGGSNVLITGLNFNNGINDVLKDQNKINPSIKQAAINNFIELYVSFLF